MKIKAQKSDSYYSKRVEGTFTYSGSGSTAKLTTVDVGFKPKKIICYNAAKTTVMDFYDEDWSTTKTLSYYNSGWNFINLDSSSVYSIRSVTDTGFTFIGYQAQSGSRYYIALG